METVPKNVNLLGVNPEEYPLIQKMVKQLGQPLCVYDLETTTNIVTNAQFGITEIAYVVFLPDGSVRSWESLVNPENPIAPIAQRVTGITQEQVSGMAPFVHHQKRIQGLVERAIMCGFNNQSFDDKALSAQSERYGFNIPEGKSLDMRSVWKSVSGGQSGTLTDVAAHYAVKVEGAHRARSDVLTLLGVIEQTLWENGFALLRKNIRAFGANNTLAKKDEAKEGGAGLSTDRAGNGSVTQGELSAEQQRVKEALDKALLQKINYEQLEGFLKQFDIQMRVSTYGVSYMLDQTKVKGSDLGSEYSWKKIQAALSEPRDKEVASEKQENPSSSVTKSASQESRGALHGVQLREEIVKWFAQGGALDLVKMEQSFGVRQSTLSFALSDLVEKEQIALEKVSDPMCQIWLQEHLPKMLKEGEKILLRPLLEKSQEAGAPSQLDYIQLRVGLKHLEASYTKNQTQTMGEETPAKDTKSAPSVISSAKTESAAGEAAANQSTSATSVLESPEVASVFPIRAPVATVPTLSTEALSARGEMVFDEEPAPFDALFDFAPAEKEAGGFKP